LNSVGINSILTLINPKDKLLSMLSDANPGCLKRPAAVAGKRNFVTILAVLATALFLPRAGGAPAPGPAAPPRFYIITDLEGPAGVSQWNQTRVAGPAQDAAKKLLTEEVNATVSGILDAEPSAAVDVWDGHGSGGLLKNELHSKSRYLRDEKPRQALVPGAYTAVFFVGQHAMAGTPLAPLAHTYSSRTIAYYRLNGCFVGEFGALAALAGSRKIPVVFISGDDKAVMEAQAWIPGIVGVAVKQGRGLESAIHLSHEEACRLLRQRAAEACRNRAAIQPLRLEPPYRLEIRYYEPLKATGDQPGKKQIDSRTIEQEVMDLAELPI
jgi:D-amino peptidase